MRTELTRDIVYYGARPYATVLRKDEDGDFVATISEFSGCMAHGSTELEALANLSNVRDAWIEMRLDQRLPIPEPATPEDALPSGRWVQRVPRSLHLGLARRAKHERVSLNQLVTAMLAEGLSLRSHAPVKSAERSRTTTSSVKGHNGAHTLKK
jgi:predicted RNase H-like HicB family nuclease